MADDKGKNLDSINHVDEEASLKKVNAQESLQDPGVREEHFKQNILMDVAEFPQDEDGKQQVEDQQQTKVSEEIIDESTASESVENIIIDESAVYLAEQENDSEKSNAREYGAKSPQNSVDPQLAVEPTPDLIPAEQNNIQNTANADSAFQTLSVDQEIEEAILFTPEQDEDDSSTDDVTTANNAPDASDSSATANEDIVFSGTLSATDPDAGDVLTFSLLTPPSQGSVTVDADGGYSFNPGDDFQDLAVGESRDVTFSYQVSDQAGATDTAVMTIVVTGSNDGPIASTPNQFADEDTVYNGQLNATDTDSAALTYTLLADTGQGDIALNTDGSFTFTPGDEFQDLAAGETRDVTFTYQVEDETGAVDTQDVTITVQGNNDAPVGIVLTSIDVDENSAGAIIGELSVTDIDINDTHIFTVDDPRFEVLNISGTPTLKLVDGQSIDYEVDSMIALAVTVTDNNSESHIHNYTLTVNDDTNEFNVSAVTDTDAASNEVSESASVGATVGVTAFASDADGDAVTYSLTSNPNNAFAIDPNTGEVTVADPSGLNFEDATSHANRSHGHHR